LYHVSVRSPTPAKAASGGAIWAALVALYIVWGSTYLAIRVAVETMPPLLMASVRFLIAGGLLYAWAIRRGDRAGDRPTARQWRSAAIIGAALLLGGNGAVVLAEQTVPSGISALIIATVPLSMVAMAGLVLRERVDRREWLGIGVGLAGIVLLVEPWEGFAFDPLGVGLLLVASITWAAGSLYARFAPLPSRPLVGAAMQMLAGGVALGLAGLVAGELGDVRLAEVSLASLLGFVYLILFGSLVGFTAYAWLIRVARTSLVSTYAYVNPIVAVLLGWAILAEPVTPLTLIAGAVIVVAVALIVSVRAAKQEVEGEPASGAPPEPLADEEEHVSA
jgi:drug/metabolite transporter (DMT)-like permease